MGATSLTSLTGKASMNSDHSIQGHGLNPSICSRTKAILAILRATTKAHLMRQVNCPLMSIIIIWSAVISGCQT